MPAFFSSRDIAASFGTYQEQYAREKSRTPTSTAVPTPPLPAPRKTPTSRKWFKRWSSPSSSTSSLLSNHSDESVPLPSSRKSSGSRGDLSESEARLGELMTQYGFGSASRPFPHRT